MLQEVAVEVRRQCRLVAPLHRRRFVVAACWKIHCAISTEALGIGLGDFGKFRREDVVDAEGRHVGKGTSLFENGCRRRATFQCKTKSEAKVGNGCGFERLLCRRFSAK
jgi:hypothetical protein